MARRRIPNVSVPRRLDRRRPRGNAIGAQHRPPRGRPGQVETIAERRVIALRLRRTGASYREIATQLAVDVATAYADVRAELGALREQTVEEAKELRDLELQRFDEMTAGLWPQVRAGSPPHVTAAVRVSERRARLLGLDAPVITKSELSGSLGVYAERLVAERELFSQLPLEQLEALAKESQSLIDRALEMVEAQRVQPAAAPLLGVAVKYYTTGKAPIEPRAAAARPALRSAESGDSDSSDEPAANLSGIDVRDSVS
jgi:hypothetical protein